MRHLGSFRNIIWALCIFLGACAGPQLGHVSEAPAYVNPDFQKIGELPPYKVQVGDTLQVKFMYNDEFDQEVVVRPDGVITTTAAQSVMAAGRTPDQIADELREEYLVHLKEPNLSVSVKSFEPTRVFVLGEVFRPGEYTSVQPNPSLMQILSRAGDTKPSAHTGKVLIVRKDGLEAPKFYLASYDDVANGKSAFADVQLATNDIVFVPKTGVADVYHVFDQYIRQFGMTHRIR